MTIWEILQSRLLTSNSLAGGQARARKLAASGWNITIGTGKVVHKTLKWSGEPYCGAKVTSGHAVSTAEVTCKSCGK
jgi:hypothetical protein